MFIPLIISHFIAFIPIFGAYVLPLLSEEFLGRHWTVMIKVTITVIFMVTGSHVYGFEYIHTYIHTIGTLRKERFSYHDSS